MQSLNSIGSDLEETTQLFTLLTPLRPDIGQGHYNWYENVKSRAAYHHALNSKDNTGTQSREQPVLVLATDVLTAQQTVSTH